MIVPKQDPNTGLPTKEGPLFLLPTIIHLACFKKGLYRLNLCAKARAQKLLNKAW